MSDQAHPFPTEIRRDAHPLRWTGYTAPKRADDGEGPVAEYACRDVGCGRRYYLTLEEAGES